jgi:hypothetical protein
MAQNSRRSAGRPFAKGQSGNPGGRPAGLAAYIRQKCGEDGKNLTDFWLLVAYGTDAEIKQRLGCKHPPSFRDRMAAADALADRGYGKPIQTHEHQGGDGTPISLIQRVVVRGANTDD